MIINCLFKGAYIEKRRLRTPSSIMYASEFQEALKQRLIHVHYCLGKEGRVREEEDRVWFKMLAETPTMSPQNCIYELN